MTVKLSGDIILSGNAGASPLINDELIITGTESGHVTAVSASGDGSWSHTMDGVVKAAPTLCKDTVYVSADGKVHAFSLVNGDEAWATPITDGDVLTAAAVTDTRVFVATENEGLVVLERSSGEIDWRHETTGRGYAPPVVTGEPVLFGFGNVGSRVVALAHAGSERWRVDMDAPFPSAAVSESTVYIADRDEIQAVTLSDGEELWPAGLQADTVRS
jgi:outer membrane protein assembly factor BamB